MVLKNEEDALTASAAAVERKAGPRMKILRCGNFTGLHAIPSFIKISIRGPRGFHPPRPKPEQKLTAACELV